jgi:Na+-translocating ferredoxin:NAD+ oxidoreductase RNF subunit RnfB
MSAANKDTIKQIYDILPKLNCGFCGFGNCGQFAVAVAESRASPFGCRQNPWVGYNISEIIGLRVPVFGYQQRFHQPIFTSRAGSLASLGSLSKGVEGLSKRIEDILDRIENLGRRQER